jgi:RimJ/RimL family protein N-acetyltransferase
MIRANDLSLVPLTAELKAAFAKSRRAFSRAVGLPLPADWPHFPEAFAVAPGEMTDSHWGGYLFASAGRIVGNGGFAGQPDALGQVEIGYEVAPAEWNRGYAMAAVQRLVRLAFENGAECIVAHSAPEWNASNRVMTKAGMRFVGVLPNAGLGNVWRFAIAKGT